MSRAEFTDSHLEAIELAVAALKANRGLKHHEEQREYDQWVQRAEEGMMLLSNIPSPEDIFKDYLMYKVREEMEKRDIQQGSGYSYALDGVLRTIQGHLIHAKERLSALKEIKPELSGSLLQAEQAVETLLSLDFEISSYIAKLDDDKVVLVTA